MPRPHAKLKGLMKERKYDNVRLGRIIHRGSDYVGSRMRGEVGWNLDECYAILDHFEIPREKIAIYFPPGGRNDLIPDEDEQAEAAKAEFLKWAEDIVRGAAALFESVTSAKKEATP